MKGSIASMVRYRGPALHVCRCHAPHHCAGETDLNPHSALCLTESNGHFLLTSSDHDVLFRGNPADRNTCLVRACSFLPGSVSDCIRRSACVCLCNCLCTTVERLCATRCGLFPNKWAGISTHGDPERGRGRSFRHQLPVADPRTGPFAFHRTHRTRLATKSI